MIRGLLRSVRRGAVVGVVGALCVLPASRAVLAFDLLGLIGLGSDNPPEPTAATLPYALTIETGEASDLKRPVEDASNLYRLRKEAPASGEALVFLAESDLPRILDAMWGEGYYNATVSIDIDGVKLQLGVPASPAAVRKADAYRGRAPVPVRIVVQPGQQFRFNRITVLDARTGRPFDPADMPQRVIGIKPGEPARSGEVLAAEARIVDSSARIVASLRQGRRGSTRSWTIPPRRWTSPSMSRRGRSADLGPITHERARRRSIPPPCDPSSMPSRAIRIRRPRCRGIRKSLGRIEALGSDPRPRGDRPRQRGQPADLRRADRAQDARRRGIGPLFHDRRPRAAMPTGRIATCSAAAEVLRFEASSSRHERPRASPRRRPGSDWSDLGWRFGFTLPQARPVGHAQRPARVRHGRARSDGGLYGAPRRRRYRPAASLVRRHLGADRPAVRARRYVETCWATSTTRSSACRCQLTYDSTDRPLDPTRGIRATAA